MHSKTAATRLPPIERALKTDILSILAAHQQQYSIGSINKIEQTDKQQTTNKKRRRKINLRTTVDIKQHQIFQKRELASCCNNYC